MDEGIASMKPRGRRILAIGLMALGGLLIFLAPQDMWIGAALLALGGAVEIAGLILAHRK